jgi:hypothetical protein
MGRRAPTRCASKGATARPRSSKDCHWHHLREDQLIQARRGAGDPVGRPGCGELSGPEADRRRGKAPLTLASGTSSRARSAHDSLEVDLFRTLWVDRAGAAVAFYELRSARRAGACWSAMIPTRSWSGLSAPAPPRRCRSQTNTAGARGRIVDPFGHEWEIGQPLGAWPPTYAASHQAGGGVRNRDAPAAINIVAPP